MSEFIKGQIMSLAMPHCPMCGRGGRDGSGTAFISDHIYDGETWVLLDSWRGKSLALAYGNQPIDKRAQLDANQASS